MATAGVPCAERIPASRASEATLLKPTICASEMVALFSECVESIGRRDVAVIFILVIVRVVVLVVPKGEGGLLVVEHGDRRKESVGAVVVKLDAGDCRVEGRGVDEGLEDGPGGPIGDGVVELALAVVASADQRQHLAGVRVERDQRDLRIRDVAGGA